LGPWITHRIMHIRKHAGGVPMSDACRFLQEALYSIDKVDKEVSKSSITHGDTGTGLAAHAGWAGYGRAGGSKPELGLPDRRPPNNRLARPGLILNLPYKASNTAVYREARSAGPAGRGQSIAPRLLCPCRNQRNPFRFPRGPGGRGIEPGEDLKAAALVRLGISFAR
jgi:hypothetical protein